MAVPKRHAHLVRILSLALPSPQAVNLFPLLQNTHKYNEWALPLMSSGLSSKGRNFLSSQDILAYHRRQCWVLLVAWLLRWFVLQVFIVNCLRALVWGNLPIHYRCFIHPWCCVLMPSCFVAYCMADFSSPSLSASWHLITLRASGWRKLVNRMQYEHVLYMFLLVKGSIYLRHIWTFWVVIIDPIGRAV